MNGYNGDWPKISVVTPSFNQGRYIEATIKSVVEQGYPNLEYLIMDGGSTDGTVEIIEKYSDQLTYWVSEPDEGQTDALIKGFDRASGDILCWLCSDDLFEARTLQEVAETFVEHPDWEVVYGDSFWIDADAILSVLRGRFPTTALSGCTTTITSRSHPRSGVAVSIRRWAAWTSGWN